MSPNVLRASPPRIKRRSRSQAVKDALALPFRVFVLLEHDLWGLSSLASDRFYYVAKEVQGYCLDVGCGRHNRFIKQFLHGNGQGIDVYPYDGLRPEQIFEDLARFPFPDHSFDTVTFIANLNHIPKSRRDGELAEAYRCLRPGGNIILTMGHPWVEILAHKLVRCYDRYLGTQFDIDSERGMHLEETYYVHEKEIRERFTRAGFQRLTKKPFATQWGLNHVFIGWKLPAVRSLEDRPTQ